MARGRLRGRRVWPAAVVGHEVRFDDRTRSLNTRNCFGVKMLGITMVLGWARSRLAPVLHGGRNRRIAG